MNILSFLYWKGCHDTSAALVCDGRLVAAAEEERFSRRKHDGAVPLRAIDFCLRHAGLTMADIDLIAFPDMPFRSGPNSRVAEMDFDVLQRVRTSGRTRLRAVAHKSVLDLLLRFGASFDWQMDPTVAEGFTALADTYTTLPPVRYYGHHLAHAALAYLSSGFDEAAIATIDGRGDPYATVTWRAGDNSIARMRAEPFTNSLGFFYRDCTRYLGLGSFGEGKTMGLAAYGDKNVYAGRIASMLQTNGPSWYRYINKPSLDLLGFPRRNGQPAVDAPYRDFAAGLQDVLETTVERVSRSAMEQAKSRRLCLGGGVALNCAANGALVASGIAESIWVFPAAGDSGLSIGAALLASVEAGEFKQGRIDTASWGPDFDSAQCEAAIHSDERLSCYRADNLSNEMARALATGQVVGWFQGRMEIGPRALGNRSILADPRTVQMRDRVNRIKNRELWRPLAPVVLADRAAEFFELSAPSPFMLFATKVRPEKRSVIPAVVHVDGSARPQTVSRDQNHSLYELVSSFSHLTNVPVLLNTSFNTASEPIVCTPEDAIKTFMATDLDLLVLGDLIVRKRANSKN